MQETSKRIYLNVILNYMKSCFPQFGFIVENFAL